MNTHRSSIPPFLFVLAGTVGLLTSEARAALTPTINEATANRLSVTLGGTFDANTIGSQPGWLAVKADWTTNAGSVVDWLADSLGYNRFNLAPGATVTENIAIGAMPITARNIAAHGLFGNGPDPSPWGDSFYWSVSATIPAGTPVSGTFVMEGTNLFDYSGITSLQLLSGFQNGNQDWARLEASAPLPEPTTALLGAIGLTLLATRRRCGDKGASR